MNQKPVICMYLLPKVHKKCQTITKGLPIITACNSNTEHIFWLLDSIAKKSVKNLDSFIEDTPDLLRFFEEVNEKGDLPPNSKPFSIDIMSFYTNITKRASIRGGIIFFRLKKTLVYKCEIYMYRNQSTLS